MRSLRVAAAACCLALPACQDAGPAAPSGDVLQLIVLEEKVACQPMSTRQCLQVIEPRQLQPRVFDEEIEGFIFLRGVRQIILVERIVDEDAPSDRSIYRYRLIRVVDRIYRLTPSQ